MALGVVYKATCTRCQEEGSENHVYIGETARTVYIRRKEHQRVYKRAAKERIVPDREEPGGSWMWEHVYYKHGAPEAKDINPAQDFTFENVRGTRDPMARQVEEAIRIIQAREKGSFTTGSLKDLTVKSLNRKDEHFAPRRRMTYR